MAAAFVTPLGLKPKVCGIWDAPRSCPGAWDKLAGPDRLTLSRSVSEPTVEAPPGGPPTVVLHSEAPSQAGRAAGPGRRAAMVSAAELR